jgi:hypothetical protein
MRNLLRWLIMVSLGSASLGAAKPEDGFWKSLQQLCGQAFVGQLVEGTAPGDAAFREQRIVMHVRSCSPDEIRIPLHVGSDRSRTWVLTRTAKGLRLKHDHRHEDGAEDEITQYGGDTAGAGTAERQEFPADAFTAQLLPAARTNIWTVEVRPGKLFSYGLRREAENRRFRIEFDLTQPVPPPPAPWGSEADVE